MWIRSRYDELSQREAGAAFDRVPRELAQTVAIDDFQLTALDPDQPLVARRANSWLTFSDASRR